ncbi:MAG: Holliday junction resolvase RuvX [Anaerolineales bacterium]|nr:Holliday junction resolvase RuvX [Anaerolineales bacterium]
MAAIDPVQYIGGVEVRILAVDHGERRIGIALSDSTATIASPLKVIQHVSRIIDAAQVAELAMHNEVGLIIIGQSFDEKGRPNLAGRRAARFADEIKNQTDILIELWDESFSTQIARNARIELGVSRKKRTGHQDAFAAVVILQSYLETKRNS